MPQTRSFSYQVLPLENPEILTCAVSSPMECPPLLVVVGAPFVHLCARAARTPRGRRHGDELRP